MKRLGYMLVAVGLAWAVSACSTDDTGKKKTDAGTVADAATDGTGGGDIFLPDTGTTKVDGAPAPQCEIAKIGTACTADAECGKGGTCLGLQSTPRKGVCVCRCTVDKSDTPLVDEDSCPKPAKCGTIRLSGGSEANFCFKLCQPKLGSNSCAKGIACTYRMGVRNFGVDVAVCGRLPCTKDSDCPVTTPTKCKLSKKNCPTGETCIRIATGSDDGICSRPGTCDTASGLCGPRKLNFKSGAKVGDTCKSDLDCDKNMSCQIEVARASKKKEGATCTTGSECCGGRCTSGKCTGPCWDFSRNGYCVINGCGFSSLTDFQCPTGSGCHRAYFGGLCLKKCSLSAKIGEKDHCRGNAYDKVKNPNGDFFGDYECRDWSGLAFRGTLTQSVQASKGPLCEWGPGAACSTFGSSTTLSCNNLAGRTASKKMRCIDPATGKDKTNPKDPTGICGDDTGSGPIKK